MNIYDYWDCHLRNKKIKEYVERENIVEFFMKKGLRYSKNDNGKNSGSYRL